MLPQKPPQPSCSYLPFHCPPRGIHTSRLMCESVVGVEVTATRQNGGRAVRAAVAPGGVKLPLVIDCAAVTVACGSVSAARLSQVAAAAGPAAAIPAIAESAERKTVLRGILLTSPPLRPERTLLPFDIVSSWRRCRRSTIWTIGLLLSPSMLVPDPSGNPAVAVAQPLRARSIHMVDLRPPRARSGNGGGRHDLALEPAALAPT